MEEDVPWMRKALRLARRGYGRTSPNPMVGAMIVRDGHLLGQGWHRRSGGPHAEIEALTDARQRGHDPAGATLYVTLEPCCTHGRTPPCTGAIRGGRLGRVVVAMPDPNPRHAGRGLRILERAGIPVTAGVLETEAAAMNEAFLHWIVRRTPFVTVKAAMTLDGRIATATGESKWITSPESRAYAMHLRRGADAILVGVNTVLADDPRLTVRWGPADSKGGPNSMPRRIVLDSLARTPASSRLVEDEWADRTLVVVTARASRRRIAQLARRVRVVEAPADADQRVELNWLLRMLGSEEVTSLLVEGGGEVNARFLLGGLTQRTAFFYGPRILGGREARRAVAGVGAASPGDVLELRDLRWRRFGSDLFVTARLRENAPQKN